MRQSEKKNGSQCLSKRFLNTHNEDNETRQEKADPPP